MNNIIHILAVSTLRKMAVKQIHFMKHTGAQFLRDEISANEHTFAKASRVYH